MDNLIATAALGIGILQAMLGLFWLYLDRQRPLSFWLGGATLTLGLLNSLEGLSGLFPDLLAPFSIPFLLLTTLSTYLLVGGALALVAPAALALSRWGGRLLLGLALANLLLVLADLALGWGWFYRVAPTAPTLLRDYLGWSPWAATDYPVLVAVGLFGSLFLLVGLAMTARQGVEQRAAQGVFLITLVATAIIYLFLEPVIPATSTYLLSNFVLSTGFFLILLTVLPAVLDRPGNLGRNLPIGSKLGVGFGSIIALTVLVGVISIFSLYTLNERVQDTLQRQNELATDATRLLDAYRTARRHERDFALQARTDGIEEARTTSRALWQESIEEMAETLDHLRLYPLTAEQQERLRLISEKYQSYLGNATALFDAYAERGDVNQGALQQWIGASEELDQLLSRNVVASRDFNERFVDLRNNQFYYLVTENTSLGRDIRRLYDELQSYVLFEQLETPLSVRAEVQVQLEQEAIAFDNLREATRKLNLIGNNLEGASTNLEDEILGFTQQANATFTAGVAEIQEEQGVSTITILVIVGLAIGAAFMLAQIATRQITRPVRSLANAATEMTAGRQGVRAEVTTGDEIGDAARSFNTMATRLDGLLYTLEERVARRTAQLETAAQVAAAASAVRDLADLLDATTRLLVERFEDIYHAQVFLVDEDNKWAVLRSSTGEAGQKLLARGHKLAVGSQSVIGQVTTEGTHVLARTMDPYSVHRPNDLLPDTKAELALPMKRGGRVVGSLDVQSTRPYAFTDDDVAVLQTLADQLTIAVENARLFENLGVTIEETEQLFRASSRIASAESRDAVLDIFVQAAQEQAELDRFSILLFEEFDADGQPIGARSVRTWTQAEGVVETSNRFDLSGVMGDLVATIEEGMMEVTDISSYLEKDPELYEVFRSLGTQSFVTLPLQAGDQYLGVLIMQRQEVGPFPESVTRLFRVLTQQATVALNRYALLDQLSYRVDELQQLRESFLDLGSSASLEKLLQALTQRAAALVGAAGGMIYLYNDQDDFMELMTLHNMEESLRGSRLRRGEGAVGHLINQREPFVVDNYARWSSRSDQIPNSQRYGAVATAPLVWQNRLLGALVTVNMRDQRRFTQDDLRRLTLFSDQAALAIENARLLREAERSLKETETLYTTTQAMMGAGSEEEMLRAIVDNLGEENDVVLVVHAVPNVEPPLLKVAAVNNTVFVIRRTPELRVRHANEMFPPGTRMPGELLVPSGIKLSEATNRIVENLATNDSPALRQVAASHGFHSLLAIPIYTREGFYGSILLLRRSPLPFQPEVVTRASTVASQFAVAYDNILLLEESKRAADQLATAAQVSRAASAQLDVDVVLSNAVELIQEQFEYYHVQVFLVDSAHLWAELRASTGEAGRVLLERQHRLGVGSRSVIGQVTAQGRYIVARSSEVDPASIHRRNELLPNTQTELALPMKVGDEVIGALDVQSVDPYAFTDEADIEILETLADQLAVAVQNARLFERTQSSLAHSQALYQAGRALAEAESLDELLHAIYRTVAPPDTFDLSILSVERDDEGVPNRVHVEANLMPQHPGVNAIGKNYPISSEQKFIIDALRQSRETVVIHDVESDARLDQLTRILYRRLKIQAGILVPLTRIGERQYVLQASLANPRHITQGEIERMGTIGAQLAIALENLYLLDNLEKRAQRLNETNELSSKLLAAPSLQELLELAAREVTQIMDVDRGGIIFFEGQGEVAQIMAQYMADGSLSPLVGGRFPLDPKLYEWLEEHREPLGVPRLEYEPLIGIMMPQLQEYGVKSLLIIPILLRGDLIGVIGLDAIEDYRSWSDVDISLGQTLSNLIASAIESTRLFEQVRRTLEQTQALYQASRAINETETLNDIARAIATHVVDSSEAAVAMIEFSLDANQLIRGARVEGAYLPNGEGDAWQGTIFSDNTLPVLRSLELNREPLLVEDLSKESRLSAREKRLFHLLGIQAIMAVPVNLPDGWTGAIMVCYPTARRITMGDLDRLIAIATQAATTMQNRELLVQTQESLLESQLLYQAGASINEAETLEGLLAALLPLAAPINPDQVVLMLFDEPVLEGERPINFTTLAGVNHHQELLPLGQTFRVRDFPIFRRLPVVAPLVFEDVQSSDMVSEAEREALAQLNLRSLLYLPLRIGTRYLGWIGFNASGAREMPDTIVRRLQNITQQAATALQSQQLLLEAQRRAWREEQISRITARLHSTTEPEEIMRIGLQELKRTLRIKRAMAWMEPESNGGRGHHDEDARPW